MRKTQDVILEAIEEIISDAGLIPTQNTGWANTGNVQGLQKGSLDTILTIGYNFQTDHFTLWLHKGVQKSDNEARRMLSNIAGRVATSTILNEVREFVRVQAAMV